MIERREPAPTLVCEPESYLVQVGEVGPESWTAGGGAGHGRAAMESVGWTERLTWWAGGQRFVDRQGRSGGVWLNVGADCWSGTARGS